MGSEYGQEQESNTDLKCELTPLHPWGWLDRCWAPTFVTLVTQARSQNQGKYPQMDQKKSERLCTHGLRYCSVLYLCDGMVFSLKCGRIQIISKDRCYMILHIWGPKAVKLGAKSSPVVARRWVGGEFSNARRVLEIFGISVNGLDTTERYT